MNYDVSLLLDGLILVFLCVTIFYAARLSIFMKSFRQSRSEIAKLIKDLNKVITTAEGSIVSMQENAGTTEVAMREVIVEAKFLSDELRFMTETGDSLADRLEKLADRNRELVDLIENAGGIGTQKLSGFDPSVQASVQSKSKSERFKEEIEEDPFDIADFDLDADEMDNDDEYDFMALEDGAYRADERTDEKEAAEKIENNFEDNFAEALHQSNIDMEAKSKVRSFAIFDRDNVEVDTNKEAGLPHDNYDDEDMGQKQFHSRAEQDLYEALQRKKQAFDSKKISETS